MQDAPKPLPTRPPFTPRQIQQADQSGFITDAMRVDRREMPTYPIDNVPANVPADRDDGIFVEAQTRGEGYRVHVTIADVAAHVPITSPLAFAIRDRGFTKYRDHMTDTMLPKVLEDRLSLEDGKERLGLTISIDLDANFQPVHTEFLRTITHPQSTDYADARARMRTDPQYGLMERIAQGLRAHFFGRQANAMVDQREKKTQETRPFSQEMEAPKMVLTFMILANHCAGLPFFLADETWLYRVFLPASRANAEDAPLTNRACYSTRPLGHSDIQKHGPKGSYCHISSPLRRAADFFNAHMMHYVIDVMDKAEQGMAERFPALDREALHHALWEDLIEVMKQLKGNKIQQVTLRRVLEGIAGRLGVPEDDLREAKLMALAGEIRALRAPIERRMLQDYANRINALVGIEIEEIRNVRTEANIVAKGEKVLGMTREELAETSPSGFTTLLKHASMARVMTDALRDEALERIREKRVEYTNAGLSILIRSGPPKDPRWAELKRAMANAIKPLPDTVNSILDMALNEALIPAQSLQMHQEYVPARASRGSAHENHSDICAAIYSMIDRTDGTIVGSPYYSIGLDARAAGSHAKYTFLTHLAFGELIPMQQSFIPNLLYAELANSTKEEVLNEIARRIGAQVQFERLPNQDGRPQARISVQGGELPEALTSVVTARTEEGLRNVAANRILRMSAFQSATQHLTPLEVHEVLYAEERLAELAKAHGYTLIVEKPREQKEQGRIFFDAEVMLKKRGRKPHIYHAIGPNQSRALSAASIRALIEEGWLVEKAGQEQGADYARLGGWEMDTLKSHAQNAPQRGL